MTTILIIDDDDQLRKSFNKLLTEEGYYPKSAASGEAGLKLIKEQLPDVVILDMRLPGMNGFETFQAIHKMEPKLPVIIMTAFGTTETAIEATKMAHSIIFSSLLIFRRCWWSSNRLWKQAGLCVLR